MQIFKPNPHWMPARKSFDVTPIHDSRFHLLALRLRVQCGLGVFVTEKEDFLWTCFLFRQFSNAHE